jgi:inositol-1,3,4-trisphosphate 5/6-kinase/inositol-tetrakisphosphate 1-kinase
MSAKKVVHLKWNDFIAFVESQGHKTVALDLKSDPALVSPRPKLDVILLKMTDELVRVPTDPECATMVENARKLVALHPEATLVDPLDCQALTIDRESMHHFFQKINALPEKMKLKCPRGLSLFSKDDKSKMPSDFAFPAMVKSLQASGALSAHDMAVVWSKDDIDQFMYPLYVQEYINHDGTIFKIYVLGEHHFTVTRVSLPNFPQEFHTPVKFNSQDWKHELPPELTKDYTGKRKEPSFDLISDASSAISQLLGLTLFGFDVIENVQTGQYAVIDVNYFPDYRGVDKIFEKLLSHLLFKFHEKQSHKA